MRNLNAIRKFEADKDEQLLYRIQEGDSDAFACLYSRHYSTIYRYCFRLLQNKPEAEDATQNTFLKLHGTARDIRNVGSVRTWMFTVARNEVFGRFRHARNNGSLDDQELLQSEDPLEEIMRNEEHHLVQQLLARLKPEYREVLILLEYEQLSYSEIAAITGHTLSSVESRIYKARKALAKRLIPYYEERKKP
ncbi:MAG TPA: hypothetical protein DCP63_01295 [Bacteroidetes bacterium]|nr:hypothetical protein [Bacteroidota bacterium]